MYNRARNLFLVCITKRGILLKMMCWVFYLLPLPQINLNHIISVNSWTVITEELNSGGCYSLSGYPLREVRGNIAFITGSSKCLVIIADCL